MTLPREFVPEARRLLKLAREDRRAATAALAALDPARQATVVLEAPLAIRRRILELLPEPENVVPLLPEAELVYTVRQIGLEDANWLLPMATESQTVACFDLDAWEGLDLAPSRLDDWIAALAATDEETLLRAARSIDAELLAIYLRQHIAVFMKPSPQEDPDWSPPDSSQTLEGQFYFVARNPKDDLAPLLTLLHALFSGDYWLYFRLIQAVTEELHAENTEWALRWRNGRLEDLGFPTWDSAMRIYGFLRPERRDELAKETIDLAAQPVSLPVWVTQLPVERGEERLLFQAIRELEPDARGGLFLSIVALANRVAVADRMALGDPDALPKAIDKTTRIASAGLAHLAERHGAAAVEVLRRTTLERLFRVGANLDPEGSLPPPLAADEDEAAGEGQAG